MACLDMYTNIIERSFTRYNMNILYYMNNIIIIYYIKRDLKKYKSVYSY